MGAVGLSSNICYTFICLIRSVAVVCVGMYPRRYDRPIVFCMGSKMGTVIRELFWAPRNRQGWDNIGTSIYNCIDRVKS